MKYEAHKGVSTEFPENTMPAFRAAAAQGYQMIELDPGMTADQIPVVLHDATLNRTCRTADGKPLPTELPVSRLSLREVQSYDAGIAFGAKHRGVCIPTLEEVLEFAKTAGLAVKIDNKAQNFSDEQLGILFDTVERTSAQVGFTCSQLPYLEKVVARFPKAEIHYDGEVSEENLSQVNALLRQNPLTVWLCLPSPLTTWVKIPTANAQLCALAKQYGELGLWILETEEQLKQAEELGADIIETTGRLKPPHTAPGYYDCHTHTCCSHDATSQPEESVQTAQRLGLAGIAFTDHCDNEFCNEQDVLSPILRSVQQAEHFPGFVLSGVEMGEGLWDADSAQRVIAAAGYDVVLGSVHAVRYAQYTQPYSVIDFSTFSPQEVDEFLFTYFEDMKEMVATADFDVLTHLTCPLRYLTGKYGISVDLSRYQQQIDEILSAVIAKGITLEVNTSCVGTGYDSLMPNREIIERYRQLGGTLVCIGSDAHQPERIGFYFEETAQLLRELGFRRLVYFHKRVAIPYDI